MWANCPKHEPNENLKKLNQSFHVFKTLLCDAVLNWIICWTECTFARHSICILNCNILIESEFRQVSNVFRLFVCFILLLSCIHETFVRKSKMRLVSSCKLFNNEPNVLNYDFLAWHSSSMFNWYFVQSMQLIAFSCLPQSNFNSSTRNSHCKNAHFLACLNSSSCASVEHQSESGVHYLNTKKMSRNRHLHFRARERKRTHPFEDLHIEVKKCASINVDINIKRRQFLRWHIGWSVQSNSSSIEWFEKRKWYAMRMHFIAISMHGKTLQCLSIE